MQFKKLLKKTLKWKCEIVLLLLLVGVLVFKLYKHKEEFRGEHRDPHDLDRQPQQPQLIQPRQKKQPQQQPQQPGQGPGPQGPASEPYVFRTQQIAGPTSPEQGEFGSEGVFPPPQEMGGEPQVGGFPPPSGGQGIAGQGMSPQAGLCHPHNHCHSNGNRPHNHN